MDYNQNMTVLAVDDSGFMRKLFKRNLIEIGFVDIVEAENGAKAIEILESTSIGLIVSDWNMPVKDGLGLLHWIRSDETYKDVPFIMATAQGDKGRIEEALNAGANAHIAKPFTSAQLKDKIEIAFGIKESKAKRVREITTSNGKVKLNLAHIQITDHLTLGVLKHLIDTSVFKPRYFELDTYKMAGWNPIQEALEDGSIDGAFVLAPIAMDLFAYDVPIRLVSLAHKNGSIFVRAQRRELIEDGSLEDIFFEHVVNIPHKMSIHHLLAHRFLQEQLGLSPGVPGQGTINVTFEVIPPIQMPLNMKDNQKVAGFIVAEPIGSNAISKGIGDLQFLSSEIWPGHPCCVVVFQEDIIEKHTDAVYEFVELLVQAGKYIEGNKEKAAEIAVNFIDPEKKLGLTTEVLTKVLNMPGGITMNDLYPVIKDLDAMQHYMKYEMGIGKLIDVEKFVDLRFADSAKKKE